MIEVGQDHWLADEEPLKAMLEACERTNNMKLVDVTVYFEILAPSQRTVPAPRDRLTDGWVLVAPEVNEYDGRFQDWIQRAVKFVGKLPVK